MSDRLFEVAAEKPLGLRERFGQPPFSVLNAREGSWQARKQAWIGMGIDSEGRGREGVRTYVKGGGHDPTSQKIRASGSVSIFDPVLVELVTSWYTRTGDSIIDPFAGGPVRGVVAGYLGRRYTGIDLSERQVAANYDNLNTLAIPLLTSPRWILDDSRRVLPDMAGHGYDLAFTCPPYYDLERYTDHPGDLSNMSDAAFDEAHADIIAGTVCSLGVNRFAVWVVGEVRGPRPGFLKGLVSKTIRAFENAGMRWYDEWILVTSVGSLSLRVARQWEASRKAGRSHQHVLIFVKGDPFSATARLEGPDA